MITPLTLNKSIKVLIDQLGKINPLLVKLFENETAIDIKTLIEWFNLTQSINSSDESFFLVTSLRASLLKELNKKLNTGQKEEDTTDAPLTAKAKYALVALGGIAFFGCEGFDGISAFMGIFTYIPSLAVIAVGLAFSIVSIIVFCSFDLVEISKNLGVKSSETPKLIDAALDEFNQIKAVRARLTHFSKKSKEELEEYLQLAQMLLQKHRALDVIRYELTLASNDGLLYYAKKITAGVAGFIFFSGGFFAGQTVSLAIGGLFVTTLSATAWPILVASVAIGLAALAVYWYVERPGIENLISRWRGLDKEKIDELCKSDVVDKETHKLSVLIEELTSEIDLLNDRATDKAQIEAMQKEIELLKSEKKALGLQAIAAEERAAGLSAQLMIKETQHVPESEPAHAGAVDAPFDEPESTVPFQISGKQGFPSVSEKHSFFSMKRSASTGDLVSLQKSFSK
ncbi:hypothetical protein [Legionella sp. WA2022007384]